MYDAYHQEVDLSTDIILEALSHKTSLLTTMAEQLQYVLKWVGWDEKKQDGIRARFANPTETSSVTRVRDQIDSIIKEIEDQSGDASTT
jgi:hypothetical protein